MIPETGAGGAAVATFLASAVEFAEAFTIVLAMGVTRGWRSALAGTAAALTTLAVTTWLVGSALAGWVPQDLLRLVVGTLLLILGLQWLRKAILRAAGILPMKDQSEIYGRQRRIGDQAAGPDRWGIDWFGFVVSFKGVLLEGLEVVLIVLTFAASSGNLAASAAGAAVAAGAVLVVGLATRRPLTRLPDNVLKFAVGLLLTTFGTFWSIAGLGVLAPSGAVEWPGGDLALLALLAMWSAVTFVAVRVLRRRRPTPHAEDVRAPAREAR
jgi:uncharacterized membrane protein